MRNHDAIRKDFIYTLQSAKKISIDSPSLSEAQVYLQLPYLWEAFQLYVCWEF
jgi:hypothetical protein